MGSLHGHMLEHPQYNLNTFVSIILSFKADVIFTEVRSEFPGAIEGSIDGGIEQSIIYAIAEHQEIEVVAIDWFNDEHIQKSKEESERASSDLEMKKRIEPLFSLYVDKFKSTSFKELNDDEVQNLVRSIYDGYDQLGYKQSRIRNENICANFKLKIKEYEGKRVLVIFGLDHKYFLDDCAKKLSLSIVDVEDMVVDNHKIDPEIVKLSLRNILESKSTLEERLRNDYYEKSYADRLSTKIKSFDKWYEAVAKL